MRPLEIIFIFIFCIVFTEHAFKAHIIKMHEIKSDAHGNAGQVVPVESVHVGEHTLDEEMLERIKAQLLEKLGLTEEPKTRLPKPVLQTLNFSSEALEISGTETVALEEDNIQDQELQSFAVFSEIDHNNTTEEESDKIRFHFKFSKDFDLYSAVSYELWLFKNNSASNFELVQYLQGDENNTNLPHNISVTNQGVFQGWLRYEVSPLVELMASSGSNVLQLQIVCTKDCPLENMISTSEEQKPFIRVLKRQEKELSREKRNINCAEGITTCCRETLYVSFESIGYDSWILEPKGYSANFCRGSCNNDMNLMRFHHGTVLTNFIKNNRTVAENLGIKISCVPRKMSGLSFIHLNPSGIYVEKNMPNMVVEECDCA